MNGIWQGIVKVQRSIVTSHPNQQFLIYNEAKTILYQGDILDSIEKRFQPNELKFYAQARYQDGSLTLEHRVPAQPW